MTNEDNTDLSSGGHIFPRNIDLSSVGRLFPELTERESECVFLFASGLTLERIATHLALSLQTIQAYIERTQGKLKIEDPSLLSLFFHCRLNACVLKALS